MTIRVLGMDPSLSNWGLAAGLYDRESQVLSITQLSVVQPSVPTHKSVRQNSKDILRAEQLATGAWEWASQADLVIVEVPVGSQSARAMASYGICVGILGALRARGIPFIEVTPTEVKLASVGAKTANKNDMIQWAHYRYPQANWPMVKRNGVQEISAAKAEHLADAIAAIHAGLKSPDFLALSHFLNKTQGIQNPHAHSTETT